MNGEQTRLTAGLRELRARTGLSLAALAARTAYSKSSWERYLNGKAMPPRQAVRELCRVAGEPDARLVALWEIAESEWSGRAGGLAGGLAPASAAARGAAPIPAPVPTSVPAPVPAPVSAPAPASAPGPVPAGSGPRRGRHRLSRGGLMLVLASVYAVIAGGAALTVLLLPHHDAGAGERHPSSSPYVLLPRCHGAGCEGRDPIRMVCGVAPDTLATHRTATGAHVELRHSEECGASWARMWGARIGDRVDVTAAGRVHEARAVDKVDADTYVYTVMVAARPGDTVRTCFRPAAAAGERECFDARVGGAGPD
ncbi:MULTISPECIES: DUF2690 domain-containing protein [unclassified Streptomyces]|uniref:helix-turn-helix domain-containing protein n=1 Tax=unclassified Streptomyces TaxID=2593676 RepID=UPI0036FF487D